MMRKTTRKAAPPRPNLPFEVPPPIDKALKTAADKVDAVRAETKTVAAKVERSVRAAVTNAKKTGETIARDPKAFAEGVVRNAKSNLETVRGDLSREAARIADEVARRVTTVVEPAIATALHTFNVPPQKDVKALAAKVDALSRKMDALHGAPKRTRARRTA